MGRSSRRLHWDPVLLLGVGSGAVDAPVGLDPKAPHQSADFSEGPDAPIPIIDRKFGGSCEIRWRSHHVGHRIEARIRVA